MSNRSFIPLFVTNFFGVINDNFLKMLASYVVLTWLGDAQLQSVFMGATGAALVVPYILFSPLADRLTVVFEKKHILRYAKFVELPIVALGAVGFFCQSVTLVILAILLMGVQSSLYSPSKYALVRDVGGEGRISTGMGGMEGIAFAAVLGGTIAASFAADKAGPWVWTAALLGFAALGLVSSLRVRADEVKSREIHAINPLRYMLRARRQAKRYRGLNAVILTLSVFWGVAAMLQLGLVTYGKQVLGLDSVHTGAILALAAVGIVVGQVLAGLVDRRHYLLGATLLTGWIAAALLAVLFFAPLSPTVFAAVTGLLAFDLGFFKLPLDAEIQKVVKGPKLNTMLAYFNQVSFLFMFLASVTYMGISWLCGPRAFLLLLAVLMFAAPFFFVFRYQKVFLFTGRWIFSRRYKVTVEGMDAVAQDQPLLVLPNHPAMVDPMLVGAGRRRSVRFATSRSSRLESSHRPRSGRLMPSRCRTCAKAAVRKARRSHVDSVASSSIRSGRAATSSSIRRATSTPRITRTSGRVSSRITCARNCPKACVSSASGPRDSGVRSGRGRAARPRRHSSRRSSRACSSGSSMPRSCRVARSRCISRTLQTASNPGPQRTRVLNSMPDSMPGITMRQRKRR